MRDIFRDSAVGQWLRLLGGKHLARYPEEHPDFKIPTEYSQEKPLDTNQTNDNALQAVNGTKEGRSHSEVPSDISQEKPSETDQTDNNAPRTVHEMEEGRFQTDVPSDEDARLKSNDIKEDITLVTWYSNNDPDCPHNWSVAKKVYIALLLLVYTVSVYIGSSLYTASVTDVIEIFGVGRTAAALGLSLYVLAYGIGPLLFAPLSEIPAIGRNPVYIYTYMIFVILCVPTSLVDNFAGLLVLRFLLGFFGSPCLANAGASYGDFFGPREMPYVIALWGGGATLSPVRHFPLP
jgi:DHA1 family multidrug resistance protein-like MFS transporter